MELLPVGDKRDLNIRRLATAPVWKDSNVRRPSGVPVRVSSEPPGADLTVEGDAEQQCQTPCVLSLAPARHTVRLRMDGYGSEVRTLEVDAAGSTLAVALKQEFGTVEFQGSQGSTPILFDGHQVAKTVPAQVKVPVGKYEIRTMQDGKILSRQDVEVTAASRSIVTVKKQQ